MAQLTQEPDSLRNADVPPVLTPKGGTYRDVIAPFQILSDAAADQTIVTDYTRGNRPASAVPTGGVSTWELRFMGTNAANEDYLAYLDGWTEDPGSIGRLLALFQPVLHDNARSTQSLHPTTGESVTLYEADAITVSEKSITVQVFADSSFHQIVYIDTRGLAYIDVKSDLDGGSVTAARALVLGRPVG